MALPLDAVATRRRPLPARRLRGPLRPARPGPVPFPETASTSAVAEEIAAYLIAGTSVLLTGLPGSGRSRVAEAVVDKLHQMGGEVAQVRGNSALAQRPLAALSLAGLEVDDVGSGSSLAALARLASSFAALAGRANTVLVIDEVDHLDAASAGVILDWRAHSHQPLLLVCRQGAAAEAPVVHLLAAAQPGVAVPLNGLPLDDITHLISQRLGRVVAADTISRIAALSGGLPGLIVAIVEAGRRGGWLTLQDGVWRADGDWWDPSLHYALAPFVQGLSPDELDCLTQLALAGVGPSDDVAMAARIRSLARRGLVIFAPAGIEVRPDDGVIHPLGLPDVQVFPPALAEWLRRSEGVGTPTSPQGFVSPARFKQWWTAFTGVEAAALTERFRARVRSEVAHHWAEWVESPVPRNAVPLLAALLSGTAGDERIATVFAKTESGRDDAAYAEYVVLTAVYRATWEHDLPGALTLLERHRAEFPSTATYMRGIEVRLILNGDRVPADEWMALPEAASGDMDALLAARAEVLLAQGRVHDALDHLGRIDARGVRLCALTRTLEALAKILDGDVAAGADLAGDQLQASVTALDPHTISQEAYVAALGLTMLGRFDELQAVVEIVHRLADTSVFQNHHKAALFLLGAFVADWEGRPDYSRNLALQTKSLGTGIGPFPGMFGNQDLLIRGSLTPDAVWDEVDDLLARGFVVAAAFLAVAAIEADPSTSRATAVIEQGQESQSAVIQALTRYVATVNARELTGFAACVDELREVCGPLDSTRALITWALLAREQGDRDLWLDRADAAWRESGRIRGLSDGLFDRLVGAVDLTEREVEVTSFVTVGLSSPEIATRLGVSARTIEANLQTIFRKTGVNSRDDLRRLARTWLNLRP